MANPPKAPHAGEKREDLSPVGFFGGMPSWIKSIVYLLCVPTVVATLSIMMLQMALQIPFGPLAQEIIQKKLDDNSKMIEAALEKQRDSIVESVRYSIDKEITARLDTLDQRLTSIEETALAAEKNASEGIDAITTVSNNLKELDDRVKLLEDWTCGPIMVDGDIMNDPDWCL